MNMGISSNELRIGNYVKHPRNDFAIVESIQKSAQGLYALTFKDESCGYWIEHEGDHICEGIEITKEVLLRCGIEIKDGIYIIEINDIKSIQGYINPLGFNIALYEHLLILDERIDIIGLKKVKYLHQLQNLYFVLTGEELILKN